MQITVKQMAKQLTVDADPAVIQELRDVVLDYINRRSTHEYMVTWDVHVEQPQVVKSLLDLEHDAVSSGVDLRPPPKVHDESF